MNLKEKVVIVTGGAKGIGKSIAEEFVRESCKVIILDVDSKEGKKIQNNSKGKIEFANVDISKEEQVKEISKYIMKKYYQSHLII